MKKNMSILALFVVLALVLAACSANNKGDSIPVITGETMEDEVMEDDVMEDETMMNEGSEAPQFTLMDINENKVSLGDYKGEKVYVKFWASWCSICLAGLDEIDTLAGEMNDFKVLTIVSPNYKGEQSTQDFKQWFNSLDTKNMTVLLDVGGMYAKEFGVRAYPTAAYIGSDGVLVQVLPGHTDSEKIKAKFEEIY